MDNGSCRRSSTATALPAEKEKCSKSSTGELTSALREGRESEAPLPRRRLSALVKMRPKRQSRQVLLGQGALSQERDRPLFPRPVDRPKPALPGPSAHWRMRRGRARSPRPPEGTPKHSSRSPAMQASNGSFHTAGAACCRRFAITSTVSWSPGNKRGGINGQLRNSSRPASAR